MTVETATQAEWKRQQRSQQISDYKAKKNNRFIDNKEINAHFLFF